MLGIALPARDRGVIEDRLGEQRPERLGAVVAHVLDQQQARAGDELGGALAAVGLRSGCRRGRG